MLTCALSGVNTFRKRQSSETLLGHTIFGSIHGINCGHPGGSAVVWRMPGHGLGGLQGLRGHHGGSMVEQRVTKHNRLEHHSYMGLCHRRLSTGGEAYGMERNTYKHKQQILPAIYLVKRGKEKITLPLLTLCKCPEPTCREAEAKQG